MPNTATSYTSAGELTKISFVGLLPDVKNKAFWFFLRCKLNAVDVQLQEKAARYKQFGRPLTPDQVQELIDLAATIGTDERDNRRFIANYDYIYVQFSKGLTPDTEHATFTFSKVPRPSLWLIGNIIKYLNDETRTLKTFETLYKELHFRSAKGTDQPEILTFRFIEEYDQDNAMGYIRPRNWYKFPIEVVFE